MPRAASRGDGGMTAGAIRHRARSVNALRRLVFDHRICAAWIVALALLMKLVVPAGYMIGDSARGFVIEICSGAAEPAMTMAGMAMPGMATPGMDHHRGQSDHPGKEMPCAFSGLLAPALAAVDPILLALALAFIFAASFQAAMPSVARPRAFLRPPLRAPPTRPI